MSASNASNGSPLSSSAMASMCGAKKSATKGCRVTHGAIVDRRPRVGPGKRASIGEWSEARNLEAMGVVWAASHPAPAFALWRIGEHVGEAGELVQIVAPKMTPGITI